MQHILPECDCSGKQCPKCKKIKCSLFFKSKKTNTNALNKLCRSCYDANKAWLDRHPEAKQRNSKSEKATQTRRQKALAWNKANPERHKAHKRKWERENREKKLAWDRSHPEKMRIYARKSHTKRRSLLNQSEEHYTPEQWKELKSFYNYKCLCCGKQEPEIKLATDHVVPVSKGGSDDINNIQPLCASCNSIKGVQIIDFRKSSNDR